MLYARYARRLRLVLRNRILLVVVELVSEFGFFVLYSLLEEFSFFELYLSLFVVRTNVNSPNVVFCIPNIAFFDGLFLDILGAWGLLGGAIGIAAQFCRIIRKAGISL